MPSYVLRESHQWVDENAACVLTPTGKRQVNATHCTVGMHVDAAEERNATKANEEVKVNKHTHKKKRKDTKRNFRKL